MKKNAIICSLLLIWAIACTKIADSSNTDTANGTSTGPGTATSDPSKPSYTPPAIPGGGTTDTTKTTDTVSNILITASSTSACAPSNEVFTFTVTGKKIPTGATYQWYFADGNKDTGITATNTFNFGGTYVVLVKIISKNQIVGTATKSITAIGQDVTPTPDFSSQLQQGTTASIFNYRFVSNSAIKNGKITTYNWDYGDGAANGTADVATHTYYASSADQNFPVKLTVVSDAGCTSTKTRTITIPANAAINISGGFTATLSDPCAPNKEVVTFTSNATSVPSDAIYNWNFGNGNQATGNPVTNSYVYGNIYPVTLTISNSAGTLYIKQQNIKAYGQNVTPIVSFSLSQTASTTTDVTYAFLGNASIPSGTLDKWEWNFGDGGNSAVNGNAYHSFSKQSTQQSYNVSLKITANSGCTAIANNTIIIPAK